MGPVRCKTRNGKVKEVFITFLSKTGFLVKIPLKIKFSLTKLFLTKFFEKCAKSVLTVLTQKGVNVFIH